MSEATLLWWGRDLYLYHAGELTHRAMGERAEPVGVIVAAVAGMASKPKGLRLIYQPSDLDIRSENCPKGSRKILRRVLGADIPALQNPDHAWCVLQPRPISEESYATVVFSEARPRLSRIQSALEAKGISLVGAWPLARLIEAQITQSSLDTGGAVGIVSIHDHVLVYSLNPLGEREVIIHEGPEAREISIGEIRRAFSQFDTGAAPIVHATHDPEAEAPGAVHAHGAWNLKDYLGADADVHPVTFPDLLRAASALRRDDLSSFLAPESGVTPSAIAIGVSVLLVAIGGFMGYQGFIARSIAEREMRHIAQVRSNLSAEVAKFSENKKVTEALNAYISEAHVTPLGRGQFMESISRSCPPAVTLTMVRVSEQGFVVAGNVTEGFGQKTGPFFTLVDGLTTPQGRLWTIPPENRPETLMGPDFSLSGRFTRAAPVFRSASSN